MNILFVVMSHILTQAQKDDFTNKYGETSFVTLQEVNPELSKQCQQVDPSASLVDILKLAGEVVECAADNNATHFYCVGEPTLTMWANIYADNTLNVSFCEYPIMGSNFRGMKCVQSTTERTSVDEVQPDGSIKKMSIFSHVQWREIFQ